jgi:hypothetical protein
MVLIDFAVQRNWLPFTVKDLEDWLSARSNNKQDDYNGAAHTVIGSCYKVAPPVTVIQETDVESSFYAKTKKTYFINKKFEYSVKRLFNFLIPTTWQNEKEIPETPQKELT